MNIVFITVVSFPYGGASSARARNLAKLFTYCGHTLHVISDSISKEKIDIHNCTYEAIPQDKNRSKAELSLETLKEYCRHCSVDVVCMNAKSDRYWEILRFCRGNNIKFIVENCEWYDSSNYSRGKNDPDYILNQKMIEDGFKEADGFISISRLLNEHNKRVCGNSVRIPTILDKEEEEYSLDIHEKKFKLVYTGRPGKSKEYLRPIIAAITSDSQLCSSFQFDIYGVNLLQLLRNINYDFMLYIRAKKSVHIHGNVNQSRISEVIRSADFQIFVRPDRRSSNAGFPTKLGESMMAGTPVIANDTGDICMYLQDRRNGLVVNGTSTKDVACVLHEILKMAPVELKAMRESARMDAEIFFDYRKYQSELDELLRGLQNV